MNLSEQKKAEFALFTVVLIWSFNTPIMKLIYNSMPPKVYTGVRFFFIGVVNVLFFYFFSKKRALFTIKKEHFWVVFFSGFFAFFAYQASLIEGLGKIDVFLASVLVCLSPIFAAIISSLFGVEKITAKTWAGLLLAFLGIVLFKSERGFSFGENFYGEFFCLLAAISWAAYTVLSKSKTYQSYPHLQTQTITSLIGFFLLFLYLGVDTLSYDYSRINAFLWSKIGFTVLFPIVIAYQFYSFGVRVLGVERTIIFVYLVPVFVGIVSIFLGLEVFSLIKFVGVFIVICGMAIARK